MWAYEDSLRKSIEQTHPDWSAETKERWIQSRLSSQTSNDTPITRDEDIAKRKREDRQMTSRSDRNDKSVWWALNYLWQIWKEYWEDISKWFDDIISDEAASKNVFAWFWDLALKTIWGVVWWMNEAILQTPRFAKDIVSMPFSDKSEWWWSWIKSRMDELHNDYWMNRVQSFLTSIDENNDSEHVAAQTVFQLLNNPLALKWVWKIADVAWWLVKWSKAITKWFKVVDKVSNVADDAAKVAKWWTKVAEQWAKKGLMNTIKQKVANGVQSTTKFLLWPIDDTYQILKTWIKQWAKTMKTTGVWAWVIDWVRWILWETIQTAGKFISKPLSYRTPRIWTTTNADLLIWDPVEKWAAAVQLGNFRKDYWYNLDSAYAEANKSDEDLQSWYDKFDIPQDKRLSSDEIKARYDSLWWNVLSNFTEWAKDLFQSFDIFSAQQIMYAQREAWLWDVDVKRNPRWEFRWLSTWKSVNLSTWEVKDADGNIISLDDLSNDEVKEIWVMVNEYMTQQPTSEWPQTPESNAEKTGIMSNNITDQLNNWAVNWMITSETEESIISWKNTKMDSTLIITRLNEASKEFTNKILNLYTPDEINNNVALQQEIRNTLNAYSKMFNWVADQINNLSEDEYNDVYRFKKAMSASYNSLDENSKNLIDSNIYQRAIDYNNSLESWADKVIMWTATKLKRLTDNMLDIFRWKDTEMWYDQWLSGIAWEVVNPWTKWRASAWWDISASINDNAAYMVDMIILNKINDSVVEKLSWKLMNTILPGNTKIRSGIRWWATEMSSEFLENLTDAVSMVDSTDTNYDRWWWLMFGMFQWAMAWFASSTDRYTSVKDYISRPENRKYVLQNMWIYLDDIKDDIQRAAVLAATSQMFDNVVGVMTDVAWKDENGTSALMQWYAIYQTNNMIKDYTSGILWDLFSQMSNVKEWNEENINKFFASQNDYNNFRLWKNFQFNQETLNETMNKQEHKDKFEALYNASRAYINTSFKTAWMSLEEWINLMIPKVDSNGKKVSTPISNTKTAEQDVAEGVTWNPVNDVVTVYTATNEIPNTIWDKMWITSNNSDVFDTKKKKYKKRVKIQTVAEDWTTQESEMTMREYIISKINNPNSSLSIAERQFVSTILFKSTIAWTNPYFKDDWSLTRLWVDFFEQVMPYLKQDNSRKSFLRNLTKIQTVKETMSHKSEQKALTQTWANEKTVNTFVVNWNALTNWSDITNIPDETPTHIKKNWQYMTVWEIKQAWSVTYKQWGKSFKVSIFTLWDRQHIDIQEVDTAATEQLTPLQKVERRLERLNNDLMAVWMTDWTTLEEEKEQIASLKESIKNLEEEREKLINEQPAQDQPQDIYEADEWTTSTKTIVDNNPETRDVDLPVSIFPEDYPDLEWRLNKPEDYLNQWTKVKKNTRYLWKTNATVPIWVDSEIWNFNATDGQKNAMTNHYRRKPDWSFQHPDFIARLPKVTLRQRDENWNLVDKTYSVVWLEDRKVEDELAKEQWLNRADWFKSFMLVDFEWGENVEIEKKTSVIRPAPYKKSKKYDKYSFFQNNKVATVYDKDWNAVKENRTLIFTKTLNRWSLSTAMQLDRMNKTDMSNAFDNDRVFMLTPYNNSDEADNPCKRTWRLWQQKVVYDARNIYTTSDIVFNPNTESIVIWWVTPIDVSDRSYDNELVYEWGNMDTATLQKVFMNIWNAQQPKSLDGETTETDEPLMSKKEVKKNALEVMDAVAENVQIVTEAAEDTPAPATESVAETLIHMLPAPVQEEAPILENNIQVEETSLEWVTEDTIDSLEELVAQENTPNEEVCKYFIWDQNVINQIVEDCKAFWIVLEALDWETLWYVISAYTQWKWLEEVIQQFANQMPWSRVDKQLVNMLKYKWIIEEWVDYDWLTLSEIIWYNYARKKIKQWYVENIVVDKLWYTWSDWHKYLYWINQEDTKFFINAITDYYISHYFNYNPNTVSATFRRKVNEIVYKKLVNDWIHIHEDWTFQEDVLYTEENPGILNEIEKISPDIRAMFATEALSKWLISQAKYNYLMESNPYFVKIWWASDYQIWPMAGAVLNSIDSIQEIWEVTWDWAPEAKLQLMFDIYSYFTASNRWTYEWLIKFLDKKYADKEWPIKELVEVLREDQKATGKYHSDSIMQSLRESPQKWKFDPYEIFAKDIGNIDAVKESLVRLERNDPESFENIAPYAPENLKEELYNDFYAENQENKSSNIAYRIVSWLLQTDIDTIASLQREENNKPLSEEASYILNNFSRRALINAEVTKLLSQRLWILWLDLDKWTVVLTDNGKNILWKWMVNTENVDSFPLLSVSDLDSLKMDVNIIVPSNTPIPLSKEEQRDRNINVIRVPAAWYIDWKLVINKIWWEGWDIINRAYNIFWLSSVDVSYDDTFKLSKDQKAIIAENRQSKSLYWNIYKNNVLPNLSEEAQNITQDEFEQYVSKSWMQNVKLTHLYKCFAAGDLQEMVDNSIAVINAATNWQLALKSNNDSMRNSVNINDSVKQFAEFINGVKDFQNSNYKKSKLLEMYIDFLSAQLQIWNAWRDAWFNDFKARHWYALSLLNNLSDFKYWADMWLDPQDLFINKNHTTARVVWEESQDEMIDRQIDYKTEQRRILKEIRAQEKVINEKEAAWRATEWQNKTEEQRNIRKKLFNTWQDELWKLDDLQSQLDELKYWDNAEWSIVINEEWEIDYDFAQNSYILQDEWTSAWEAYADNAMKALAILKANFIDNNLISVAPGEVTNIKGTKILSNWLLWIISWQEMFYTDVSDASVSDTRERSDYAISKRDIRNNIQILSTLKETNVELFNKMLDYMFNTVQEIWYTVDTWVNKKLLRAKNMVAQNPANLMRVYNELSRDPWINIDNVVWWQFEKNLTYQWINLKWALNSISTEYFRSAPYIYRSEWQTHSMNENLAQYHKDYDKYFGDITPSDEQVKAFAMLKDAFEDRKNPADSTSKIKVFAIPGIAWAWKTTLIRAFFNRVKAEWKVSLADTDNIKNGVQTSLIYNFNKDSDKIWRAKKWEYLYAKVTNIDWSWWDTYIRFKKDKATAHQNFVDDKWNLKLEELRKWWYWEIRDDDAIMAIAEVWKYARTWDRWWDFSKSVRKIDDIEVISADDYNKENIKLNDIKWNIWTLTPQPNQFDFWEKKNKSVLWDIEFAVRMWSTIWSLKDAFKWEWVDGINMQTLNSYFEVADPTVMHDMWFSTSYVVKPWKNTSWKFIIVDEAQNAYDPIMTSLTEQLWGKNVIVMLWDFHQNSKWTFLQENTNESNYMLETHRWTKDINTMNEINWFTQQSLIKQNAIWMYMVDSEDFIKYKELNPDLFNSEPKKTLYITSKNDKRKEVNNQYIQHLWWMKKIISSWKTLQVMLAWIDSNKRKDRERNSEMPDGWLNMKWFKEMADWKFYYKNENWVNMIFVPQTKNTDLSDTTIQNCLESLTPDQRKWVEVYVPAFAITSDKSAWKTVENIILDEDITNSEYDFLSEQSVKRYYDAFTRWAKKVYLPEHSSRLIWITRQQAEDLMNWKPLTEAIVPMQEDKVEQEYYNSPVFSSRKRWPTKIVQDILDFANWAWADQLAGIVSRNIWILNTYNLATATVVDNSMWYQDYNIWTNYMDSVKKEIADAWDLWRNKIKSKLEKNKNSKSYKKNKAIFDKIDATIYWKKIQIPVDKDTWRQIWDRRVIRAPKNLKNKRLTISDLQTISDWIKEWNLTEWLLYIPETTTQKDWSLAVVMKQVEPKWIDKFVKWWINYTDKWELSAIDMEREKRVIDNIFMNPDKQQLINDLETYLFWNATQSWILNTIEEEYSEVSDMIMAWTEYEYVDSALKKRQDVISNNIDKAKELDDIDDVMLSRLKEDALNLVEDVINLMNWDTTIWQTEQEYYTNEIWLYNDTESEFTCN